MLSRPFGNSGLVVSALGLGAGALGDEARLTQNDVDRLLDSALDCGVTLIDTARSYGASEDRIGRWIGSLKASKRQRVVLSTKTGYGVAGVADWTGECVARGIDDACARMQTDVIDIVHLHSCPRQTLDQRQDVMDALERAREAGKIKVAAYSGENDALSWAVDSRRFGSIQCSVSLFDQRSIDREVKTAAAQGMGVIAKRALANAPWRFREQPHSDYCETYWKRMKAMAIDPGCEISWEDFALRFAAFAPGVSCALVGTTNVDHLRANVRALEAGPLSSRAIERIRSSFDEEWRGEI